MFKRLEAGGAVGVKVVALAVGLETVRFAALAALAIAIFAISDDSRRRSASAFMSRMRSAKDSELWTEAAQGSAVELRWSYNFFWYSLAHAFSS